MKGAPMTPEDITRRRDEIVARWGAWRSHNLRLAEDLYTIAEGVPGDALRVRRALQQVRDLAGGRLSGLRVLDLGSGEGGLAIELGKQGAEVLGVEGRLAHVEKADFAREALGVRSVTFVRGDARQLSVEEHGFFDIVIALGILDRLDAPDVFEVAKKIGAVCKRFVLLEARLAGRPRATREFEGLALRGVLRREHPPTSSRAERLAALDRSLDNDQSFLLTRASWLRLLTRAGFTSVAEVLDPEAAAEAPWFAAFKGRRVALATAPQANAEALPEWRELPQPVRPVLARLLRPPKR